MDTVFFPLDEELALLPGSLAPRQQEHLVHLACFMPFDKAAQMVEEILAVHTNEETVRQLTEHIGACMEAVQTAEADGSHESHDQPPLLRCVFSADGAMISLVHTQWAETRTVAIGELEEQPTAENKQEIHVGHLSYFSRLADASTFLDLAEVEMRRRKVKEAKQVCAVMDGADWLQVFTDRHRPDALRILDFPHAAEHLTQLLEALEKVGRGFPPQLLSRCLHVLKHRGPRPLLRMADRLESNLVQHKEVNAHLDYLRKREKLMQYPVFRRQGWPIGSGMVESANKNVVEVRLKGTGMHWERNNVNPMLTLRNAICNDRWREMWHKALNQHRKLQALQRSARAEQRPQAFLAVGNSSCLSSPPQSATVSEQISSPAPCQSVSEAEAPPVPPSLPVPTATQPSSCRHSSRRKRQTARNRVKYSPQKSSEVNTDVCRCGAALVRYKGHRTKQYCSDRCRMRSHRSRQAKHPSRLSLPHRLKQEARQVLPHQRVHRPGQPFVKVSVDTCPCGTPLTRLRGHRPKEYCSDRCRQRAFRWRQAKNLSRQRMPGCPFTGPVAESGL